MRILRLAVLLLGADACRASRPGPPVRLAGDISDTIIVNSRWPQRLPVHAFDAKAGAAFVLKPKGAPKVKMTIDELRPYVLVDTAYLLGAKMRTTHEYVGAGGQTTIRFAIEVSGPLGFLWRKVVGENQIREAPAQLNAFVAYARTSP